MAVTDAMEKRDDLLREGLIRMLGAVTGRAIDRQWNRPAVQALNR